MARPRDPMSDREDVIVDLHPHWWYFAESASALVAAIAAAIVVANVFDGSGSIDSALTYLALAAVIVCVVWVALRYLKWMNTHFVVTSHRIIFRQGVIGRSGIEIPLERVNNVNFQQSIFERLIGAGDLLIESGGESGQERFTDVRHPHEVQGLIHVAIADAPGARQSPAPEFDGDRDVVEQLERLEALRDRGAISDDEFDRQKRRLIG